ncbi:MAG: hypothetical protein HZA15_01215 [Nitrospirae bacterium]|nr:hypothetical protein [Nitrospirota bacterium]
MGITIKAIRLMPRMAFAIIVLLMGMLLAQSALALPEKNRDNRVLALKPQKNISLNDLIQTAGYSISDEDVVLFLTEFIELNPSVKSVSLLKKGTMVRMPVRHLKKTAVSPGPVRETGGVREPKQLIARRRLPARLAANPVVLRIDSTVLLGNIQRLFSALGEDVSVEKEGFKYLSLGEKSDISFDTGLFPIMDLHNDRILVIDYTGIFPDDMKNLLEVSWPEYRVVSPRGKTDLRGLVPLLLQESGYLFQENSRMVSGGAAQAEYHADFLVHGKNGKPMDSDISLVSVLGSSEYQTPPEIISWFMNRDVRIIELSEQDMHYANRNPGSVIEMRGNTTGKVFIENVLTLMGYSFSRDEKINLSAGKAVQLNVHADLLIDMGYKRKIVEFAGVSDQEMKYIRKLGLDIAHIEHDEGKNDMIRKILSLLSLAYTNSPQKNAASLTQKNSRYRLLVPGFVVKSLRGVFFMTDADLDEELKKSITSEGISMLKF